jgi:SprT protein
MNLADAETLARDLMAEYLDASWSFHFDTARKRFGCCKRSRDGRVQQISISRALTAANDREQVENTLRHEIAHALAPMHAGHGPAWREACAVTGARPVPCYGAEVVQVARWRFVCEGCGIEGRRDRRPSSATAYHCRGASLRWERAS